MTIFTKHLYIPDMKKYHTAILLSAFVFLSFTSDKPAYQLFDQEGKKVKYEKMINELEQADIIFFGELHTDPIAHWLQLEMTKEFFERKQEALILGAEMFEADNQLILTEYLNGMYNTEKFEAEMRLWGNYQTDYKPLVEFAKENHIPFIATNIPRRYADVVHKKGFEGLEELSGEAKAFMAPLPMRYDPEVACYKNMLAKLGMGDTTLKGENAMPGNVHTMPSADTTAHNAGTAMPGKEQRMPGKVESMPGNDNPMHAQGQADTTIMNLPRAQAAKDATMAHFILENWTAGKTMFHFNGSYHSENFEGIVWHLLQQNADLKIMTISTVLQPEIESLTEENINIANYIVCVPESMTRTKR
jgi:uncharacterized iron-regulated protein